MNATLHDAGIWAAAAAQLAHARRRATPELLAVAHMVLDTASDTTPPELLAAATAAIAKAIKGDV